MLYKAIQVHAGQLQKYRITFTISNNTIQTVSVYQLVFVVEKNVLELQINQAQKYCSQMNNAFFKLSITMLWYIVLLIQSLCFFNQLTPVYISMTNITVIFQSWEKPLQYDKHSTPNNKLTQLTCANTIIEITVLLHSPQCIQKKTALQTVYFVGKPLLHKTTTCLLR